MNEEIHARARQLIAQERVESISQANHDWLSAHLQECVGCAERARHTEHALRALRTTSISLPHGLVSRTQFRVQLRLQEMREREPRRRALWAACIFSWVFGVVSAPYVWRLFQWFGERTGVPKLVWELGFGLWWTIPALFFVAVVFMEKMRQGTESDLTRQSR
jgi:hypothetical protein